MRGFRMEWRGVLAGVVASTCVVWAGKAGLEPAFRDSFADYSDARAVGRNWEGLGGSWALRNRSLVLDATAGSTVLTAIEAPDAERQVLEVSLTVLERPKAQNWAVAGLLLRQDRSNYWQLALVEGPPPERKRYVELGDMVGGAWKAQTSAGGPVQQALSEGADLAWEYGTTYLLRLELSPDRITGEIVNPKTEKRLTCIAYSLSAGAKLTVGRLGVRANGFKVAMGSAAVWAQPPPSAAELGIVVENGSLGRAAVLDDSLPATMRRRTASYASALRRAGIGVTSLTAEKLGTPGALLPERFDMLVLPNAPAYPAAAGKAIDRYLRAGGDLIAVGGIPFSEPCLKLKGEWRTRVDAEAEVARTEPEHILYDFDAAASLAGWIRQTARPEAPSRGQREPTGGGGCLRVDVVGLSGWDTLHAPPLDQPLPDGHVLTCFRAKGDDRTPDLAVEWQEKDGSRWIAVVPLTTEWRRYALPPNAFSYWPSGDGAAGRGGDDDALRLANAAEFSVGLAFSHTSKLEGDHTYWIDDVGMAPSPLGDLGSAGGETIDLGAFSDAYPFYDLSRVTRASSASGQCWLPGGTSFSAASFRGLSVAGFPKPNLAAMKPLLTGFDSKGRPCGNVLTALVNVAGKYRRSVWVLSGLTNDDALTDPVFVDAVAESAKRCCSGLFLTVLETDRLTYPQGGAVGVEVEISNVSRQAWEGDMLVSTHEEGNDRPVFSHTVKVALPAGTASVTELKLPATAVRDGCCRLRVEIAKAGAIVDAAETTFEVLAAGGDSGVCRGPIRLTDDGRHLATADGKRFFCIGANYTAAFDSHGRFWQNEFFSPRRLELHFRKSRDAGINCWRFCGWCWSGALSDEILAGDFTKIDLFMALAHRYGVYQLITPPGSHHFDLAKRLEVYTALARHLRGHPAVLGYDLLNEPGVPRLCGVRFPEGTVSPVQEFDFMEAYPVQLRGKENVLVKQARERRIWRNRLAGGLSYDQAFNVACANMLYGHWRKTYDMSFSTFPEIDEAWPPTREWAPFIDTLNGGLEAWVKTQVDALREADPTHLITVGYNQVLSCFPGNKHLDFVSQHVYQRPHSYDDVRTNITTLDRLRRFWPDKPITFGEFGYTNGIELKRGDYLDIHSSAVGEMAHWLYAVANDYDGCKKWVLNDHPLPYMHHFGNWGGRGLRTQIYEERFGLYAYDGTPAGRPKPICHCLRFLRRYIDRTGPQGEMEIKQGLYPDVAHYVFRGNRALFVGGREYDDDGIRFSNAQATNVMLDWAGEAIAVMASSDVQLEITPKHFVSGLKPRKCEVVGACGDVTQTRRRLTVQLLEGEMIEIRRQQ